MKDSTLLKTGIKGSVITMVCWLAIFLGVLGMSALAEWLDFVLFPALAIFLGLTLYALWSRSSRRASSPSAFSFKKAQL